MAIALLFELAGIVFKISHVVLGTGTRVPVSIPVTRVPVTYPLHTRVPLNTRLYF